ncbi:MAG: phosphotransferase [Granulosicoccus sp.]|nr:phosphotransferase [Granulosicoccus sp.]
MSSHTSHDDDLQKIKQLNCWSGDVQVSPLEGGITNHNYRVQDNDASFVARLGDDIPEHLIMRFNEVAAGKAAHAAGLSPAIVHHEKGVLVMEYISAEPLTAERIQERDTLEHVLQLLLRCHYEIPKHLRGASTVFWVFHVIRDYVATLIQVQSPYCDQLDQFLATAEQLESTVAPFDIVFGHNDLLPANILDDGDRLWLIDWEYAGFNSPLFDLGGLASNNNLNEDDERWMLEKYFDKPVSDERWVKYSAMKCASLLRETLWSMVSEIHSTLDFDYAGYTRENLDRYQRILASFKAL